MRNSLKDLLKELGYRIGGAALAVGGLIFLVEIGNRFNIGLLQSSGGVFITLIVLGELLFFSFLAYAVATGKF